MRTTINIDDDVLHLVREIARQQNLTTGAVVSRLLHRAILGDNFAGFRPFSRQDTAVDNDLIDRLRDEGEV